MAEWKTFGSEEDATCDTEISIDVSLIVPQISGGTSPAHTVGVDGVVPDPAHAATEEARKAIEGALQYVDLQPGTPVEGIPIDRVFFGSCTNSRIGDLRTAAGIVKGQQVAEHVTAWVAPGSYAVKRQAEAEGLDQIFRQAGLEWREPGCSLCVAWNGEGVAPGERCLTTSHRNFVGRQGPQARTHLASPAMAAAAAMAGHIADVRQLEQLGMEKFTTLTGLAALLMLENVDTDVITPMELMVTYGFGRSVGRSAFAPLRYIKDERAEKVGRDVILHPPKENPEFVLNQEPFRQAKVPLAGRDFGCGSSREMAVWAIARVGYRCLIAPSFGEIFYNNCFKNGVVPIVSPRAVFEGFAEMSRSRRGEAQFTVDLNASVITSPLGEKIAFEVEATRGQSLPEGLDEIRMTVERESEIADFQQRNRQERPWVYVIGKTWKKEGTHGCPTAIEIKRSPGAPGSSSD